MADVSVENDPVVVGIEDAETFTPAAGTVVKVQLNPHSDDEITVETDGVIVDGVASRSNTSAPSESTVVLDDTATVKTGSFGRALITGFVL